MPLAHAPTRASRSAAPAGPPFAPAMRGEDPALRRALAVAKRAAASDCGVVVVGETGTGKELVARAIHDASARAAGPFVPINCGAIPQELVESELFGHERGAFTGATAAREGVFVEASGGTLFLDELGELPLPQQPHLLRAVETGRVRRVGGRGEIPVDTRIVAATHRSTLGGEGSPLRSDLYHRLATITVEIPPLRARKRDIPILVRTFLEELEPSYGPRRVPDSAMRALLAYSWPGNVRELRHALRRAAVLCDDELTPEALLPARQASELSAPPPPSHHPHAPALGAAGAGAASHYELALRSAMQDAYGRWGSLRSAARALGMPKSTFADRARRFGIVGGSAYRTS